MTTTAEVKSNKNFVPWTAGGNIPLKGLFVRHTLAKGSSNGYVWDEGFVQGRETLTTKNIEEYDTGTNTVQVYCNINNVLYRSGEMKPSWSDNSYAFVWLNFYKAGSGYVVKMSLDGASNQSESNLSPL